jgi:DNA-binding NtrC family response regulator
MANDRSETFPAPEGAARPAVLCVDDDAAVLSALRRSLRGESFDVLTASNAAHALASLRRNPVEVIISDQRMPGQSGAEFLAEVGQRWPRIGRVILTGYPGPAVLTEGIRAGIDFLFQKPWDDDALKSAVHRLIRRKQRREAPRGEGDGVEFDVGGEGG